VTRTHGSCVRTGPSGAVRLALALAALGVSGCSPEPATESGLPERVIAVVDAAPDPRSYDPAHPPVPLTAVETGGGRIELAGLWRRGNLVRAAIAAETVEDGFMLSGRFGPLLREMGGMLLVDPAQHTAYPVLTPPGATGLTACLCSPSLLTARRRLLYHADFQVPESVGDVLVLGDSTPPFGRVRIATTAPDLRAAGYTWMGVEPPPLGDRPFEPTRARAALVNTGWPAPSTRSPDPGSVSLPADLLFTQGSAELPDGARDRLGTLVDRLRALPAGAAVTVVGHTDSRGTATANLRLSRRRAQAVAEVIARRLGRADVQVVAEGRGRDEPLVPNTDEGGEPIPDNQARNRRVEIIVPVASATARDDRTVAGDATRAPTAEGELAAVEVVPDARIGDRVHVGVEAVSRDADLGLVRLDLRLGLAESERKARRSLLGDEALSSVGSPFGDGARDLRLLDPATGATVSPAADALDHCLCPDEIGHTLLAGSADRFSVWFPAPPQGTGTVTVLVPKAGLLRDLPIT
jgi:outer membrane protein OmpA-like peptidoglycan-associated protein